MRFWIQNQNLQRKFWQSFPNKQQQKGSQEQEAKQKQKSDLSHRDEGQQQEHSMQLLTKKNLERRPLEAGQDGERRLEKKKAAELPKSLSQEEEEEGNWSQAEGWNLQKKLDQREEKADTKDLIKNNKEGPLESSVQQLRGFSNSFEGQRWDFKQHAKCGTWQKSYFIFSQVFTWEKFSTFSGYYHSKHIQNLSEKNIHNSLFFKLVLKTSFAANELMISLDLSWIPLRLMLLQDELEQCNIRLQVSSIIPPASADGILDVNQNLMFTHIHLLT